MFKLLVRFGEGYNRYMTKLGRERARQALLGCNDRLLEDNGFSRDLLESGVHAWPWRVEQNDDRFSVSASGLSVISGTASEEIAPRVMPAETVLSESECGEPRAA